MFPRICAALCGGRLLVASAARNVQADIDLPSCPAQAGHPVRRAIRENRDTDDYWITRFRG